MSSLIIGLGEQGDRNRIALVTRSGWDIPNSRRPLPRAPESLKAGAEMHLRAHASLRLRSLSADYNCVGLVFASRRTAIDPDHLARILDDDGYREIAAQECFVGDVVTYSDNQGRFAHVGLIVQCTPDLMNASLKLSVLSQWGSDGEYTHDLDDVHDLWLTSPRRFWTERKV